MRHACALGTGIAILAAAVVGCGDRGLPDNAPAAGTKTHGATNLYAFFGAAGTGFQFSKDVAATGTDGGGGADAPDAHDPGPFNSEL